MDASEASWLSDLLLQETEDCNLFRQCQLELLDDDEELLSHEIASAFENLQQPLYSESHTWETLMSSFTDETSFERPTKQPKTNASSWNSSSSTTTTTKHFSSSSSPSTSSSPTSKVLSFDNSDTHGIVSAAFSPKQKNKGASFSLPQTRKRTSENQNFETESPKGQRSYKSPPHARDHIIAERKRRENLSQSLIALAALIPGLKKMDKATVLGDAIKYVKELQERLRMLEEENKNRDVESVVMVNNDSPRASREDEGGLDDGSGSRERLPRVEARVSEKDVLLRIHCQKQKGLLLKILVEIQNLHLFAVNSSVLPFGDSILDITIVAQMDTGYNLTINDLVKNLRVAILKSMSMS